MRAQLAKEKAEKCGLIAETAQQLGVATSAIWRISERKK